MCVSAFGKKNEYFFIRPAANRSARERKKIQADGRFANSCGHLVGGLLLQALAGLLLIIYGEIKSNIGMKSNLSSNFELLDNSICSYK